MFYNNEGLLWPDPRIQIQLCLIALFVRKQNVIILVKREFICIKAFILKVLLVILQFLRANFINVN